MAHSDAELIKRTLDGDETAFGLLVDKYKGTVHARAYRKVENFHTAEEITQDTFLKAYQKLSTLRDWEHFPGWLNTIVSRLCLMWHRKQRLPTQPLDTAEMGLNALAQTRYTDEQARQAVHDALEELSESQRTVLTLYYLDGMTCEEIARFIGTSRGAVFDRLYRARAQLREELIPTMRKVLKSQAPKQDFPNSIMEILSKMEAAAKAIHSVQLTVEDHFGGWMFPTQVAYTAPNQWRIETENVAFVCNGEKIWQYDKLAKLVIEKTVNESDKPVTPKWQNRMISTRVDEIWGMRPSIAEMPFLFTPDQIDSDAELRLESSQQMHLLRMTKPNRNQHHRTYYHPRELPEIVAHKRIWKEPLRPELAGADMTFYSFFTWEIPSAKDEMRLGIDARTYLPLLQQDNERFGKIEVKQIHTFKNGIHFPKELSILNHKGERHILYYVDVHVNKAIPLDKFSLEIPSDVVIIDEADYKDIEASIARYETMLNTGTLARVETVRCLYALADLYAHRKVGSPEKNYARAIQFLEEICQIEPGIPIVYWDIANNQRNIWCINRRPQSFEEIQSKRKCIKVLEMSAKTSPHPANIQYLAELYREYRQPFQAEKALAYQKQLIEICDSRRKIGEANRILEDALDAGGPLESTVSFYEAKLSDEAGEPYLWKLLGTLYCERGETDKAIPYFKRYIQWWKTHLPAAELNFLDDMWIKAAGLLVELADLYQTYLQHIPADRLGIELIKRSGSTLTHLLEIYFRFQDFPKLASVFEQICAYGARTNSASDRLKAGSASEGLPKEATLALLENMKRSCKDARLWVFMGDLCRDAHRVDFEQNLYVYMDDIGDAEECYKRAIELDEQSPLAYAALGDLYFSQKKYQDAAEAYECAAKLAPIQPYFVAQFAHSMSGGGEHESAIEIAQQLTEQLPADKDAHRVLGVVYLNASRYEEAIEQFELGLDNEFIENARRTGGGAEQVIAHLLARAYDRVGKDEALKTLTDRMEGRARM